MEVTRIESVTKTRGEDAASADRLIAKCLAAAANGSISAYFDLGVAYSTGSHGVGCDLIEAHKWFNIAAMRGHADAARLRREIAEQMSDAEIGRAQRSARDWLKEHPQAPVPVAIRVAA